AQKISIYMVQKIWQVAANGIHVLLRLSEHGDFHFPFQIQDAKHILPMDCSFLYCSYIFAVWNKENCSVAVTCEI
ncbi:hypothetical protein ACJX0J_012573, partial [Zea mays]